MCVIMLWFFYIKLVIKYKKRGTYNMANVTILGAGAMGSALSTPLRKNGHNVNLWGTHLDTKIIDQLKKDGTHIKHKCKLADGINYFYNEELEQAMEGADLVIMGITSDGLASVFKKAIPYLKEGMVVGSVSKGFEYDLNQKDKVIILPDILEELLPDELAGNNSSKISGKIITLSF